ncbi:TRAP transporter small permease subunit [candidate division KSB3 bacterium]|uniref:TRAP transporter small permease subunit n=1 Tax=candidate division KSB3 bacterium TaxID=2044937 RepID=A0A9D5Q842_9BACT|nr:TRAP transporter small permease subunit [candidate division KSB3 bacterium]MBD3326952.1 TRAP transporter small permease subunit [candidate division KSB3 bacterium]
MIKKLYDLAWPLRIAVGVMFATIVGLTIAQVFFRFVLDDPLIWSEELARLLLVWVTFIGAAVVCWDGRHLNVDAFFVAIPEGMRRVVRLLNAVVAIIFLGILVYFSIPLIQIDHMTELGALEIPGSYVRLPAAIGGGLMIFFILLRRFYRLRIESRHPSDEFRIENEPM